MSYLFSTIKIMKGGDDGEAAATKEEEEGGGDDLSLSLINVSPC